MSMDPPYFQQYLHENKVNKAITQGIRSFFLPIKPDLQFPLLEAYQESDLQRDELYIAIQTVDTFVSKIESRTKLFIYMDIAVWRIPKRPSITSSLKEWLLRSWMNMDKVIKDQISYRLGLYFDNYSHDVIRNTVDLIMYFCQQYRLSAPTSVYINNPKEILKLKDFMDQYDIRLYVHIKEDNMSNHTDEMGLSTITLQNTFYTEHNIGILSDTGNNEILK